MITLRYLRLSLFFLFYAGLSIGMQRPDRPDTDENKFTTAASRGNIKGLDYGMRVKHLSPDVVDTQEGRTALGWAARSGQPEAVQYLLNQSANPNIPDRTNGLTPLAWAATAFDPAQSSNYLPIVQLLVQSGADVRAKDNNGITVLHKAAGGGNAQIVDFLLNTKAKQHINDGGSSDKGRTPLAEVMRASKDAIIHVDIEKENFMNQAELERALPEAITQLKKKESKKISTHQIIPIVQSLRRAGARSDIIDASKKTLDHYINEVQLISEDERIALLTALGIPVTPRPISFTEADLPDAIQCLKNLDNDLQRYGIGQKVKMVIWAIQIAQQKYNRDEKFDALRIALALLAKVKEDCSDLVKDPREFAKVETRINRIRLILRDTALVVSGKSRVTQPAPKNKCEEPAAMVAPAAPKEPRVVPPAPRPVVAPAVQQKPFASIPPQAVVTLFMAAISKGALPEVARLVEGGANVNAQNHVGITPLMWATKSDELGMVIFLLESKANPRIQDKDGHDALWYARNRDIGPNKQAIIDSLQSFRP